MLASPRQIDYESYFRPASNSKTVERTVNMNDPKTPRETGSQKLSEGPYGYDRYGYTHFSNPENGQSIPKDFVANPYQVPGIEQYRSAESRQQADAVIGTGAGLLAAGGGVMLSAKGLGVKALDANANTLGSRIASGLTKPVAGTRYLDADAIKGLARDSSKGFWSPANLARGAGRLGVNAAVAGATNWGVDALTTESDAQQAKIIAEMVHRKYGYRPDDSEALTYLYGIRDNQKKGFEQDPFDNPNVRYMGMQYKNGKTLTGELMGMRNPLWGGALRAAQNWTEKPARMSVLESVADRLHSEKSISNVRSAAEANYGPYQARKKFPDLGWSLIPEGIPSPMLTPNNL